MQDKVTASRVSIESVWGGQDGIHFKEFWPRRFAWSLSANNPAAQCFSLRNNELCGPFVL